MALNVSDRNSRLEKSIIDIEYNEKKKKVICHTGELQTIDRLSTSTILVCEIPTLGHELFVFFFSVKGKKTIKTRICKKFKRTPGMTLWKMLPSYPNPC